MTQEEKAKAYDEALDRMKHVVTVPKDEKALQALKETVFPELSESDDERIIKTLQEYVKNRNWPLNGPTQDEVLAYLEKQKEQKPAESISQLPVQGKGVYKICPRCKERMVRDDSMVYTSMPPQYRYECPKCGEGECDTVMYDNPEMDEPKTDVEICPHSIKSKSYSEQKSAEDKELLKYILFQKKGITYDDYKCKNDPYVGLYFYELIKCLEEYDKARCYR